MKTSRRALLALLCLAVPLAAAPSASAQVVASPQAVQFGKQARNTNSAPRSFVLVNVGQTVQIIPGDQTSPPFTFDAPGGQEQRALLPQQTQVVQVTFRPTALGQVVRAVNYSTAQFTAIGTGTAKNEIDGTDGNDTLTGTRGDDVITCGKGDDKVKGGGGNDVIKCGDGKDVIEGGDGKDRIEGNDGNDRVNGGKGNDRINGGKGNDKLSGASGDDKLSGASGNDKLFGDSGRDKLFGDAGRDTLRGGSGRDRLVGGPGRDSARQ